MTDNGLLEGADGVMRCWWCGDEPEYVRYHDEEWGFVVADDRRLFEKICLEGFQSGLSWFTILRKREGFRRAFDNFDHTAVARYTDADVERLLQDRGIVRHRKKIESTINNARRLQELLEEFPTLAAYVWSFEPSHDERPHPLERANMISKCPSSIAMARDLKKRGWSFVGPTTAYAFMQSVGIVNDHLEGCALRDVAAQARVQFLRENR